MQRARRQHREDADTAESIQAVRKQYAVQTAVCTTQALRRHYADSTQIVRSADSTQCAESAQTVRSADRMQIVRRQCRQYGDRRRHADSADKTARRHYGDTT